MEEDKWRSADEEKKMRFSDKCVFGDMNIHRLYVVSVRRTICVSLMWINAESLCLSQVVEVHQETVDLYLEDLILETLERTIDQQAREDVQRRAQEVNNIAFAMEER